MKIIDLLNKIANGEEVPKRIRVGNSAFELSLVELNGKKHYSGNTDSVLNKVQGMAKLNDEVEIIEEDKKIEKINMKWDKDYYVLDEDNVKRYLSERDKIEINKINEIIDYLMENKNEKRD